VRTLDYTKLFAPEGLCFLSHIYITSRTLDIDRFYIGKCADGSIDFCIDVYNYDGSFN
jgi:hypothetical protein